MEMLKEGEDGQMNSLAGLAVIDAGEPKKRMVTGAVIIAAAVLDYYRQRIRRSAG